MTTIPCPVLSPPCGWNLTADDQPHLRGAVTAHLVEDHLLSPTEALKKVSALFAAPKLGTEVPAPSVMPRSILPVKEPAMAAKGPNRKCSKCGKAGHRADGCGRANGKPKAAAPPRSTPAARPKSTAPPASPFAVAREALVKKRQAIDEALAALDAAEALLA